MNIRDKQIGEKLLCDIAIAADLLGGFSQEEFAADERTARAVCMTHINISTSW